MSLLQFSCIAQGLDTMPAMSDRLSMRSVVTGPRLDPIDAQQKLRSNNFDFLRLLLASVVALFHISVLSGAAELRWMNLLPGTLAVQCFFVISGFLIFMSYERSSSIRTYVEKRIRRIAPAYVLAVVGAAFLLATMSELSVGEYFSNAGTWRYLVYNLALANFKAPDLPGVFPGNLENDINGSLWTIKIEVGFYILVPALVWLVRRHGYRSVLGAVIALSMVWRFGFDHLSEVTGSDFYGKLAIQLPGQLSFFAGGAWSYYRLCEGRLPAPIWAVAGVVSWVTASGPWWEVIAPFAVAAVVSCVALANWRLPQAARWGDFSYGVYIYHFPIAQTCIALGMFASSAWLGFAATICLLALISVASWNFLESPMLSKGKARLKRIAVPTSPTG
jgi:peptidoglycan/LPS O-acetylase OafA/YrhL